MYVPGNDKEKLSKLEKFPANAIIIDLEDAVPSAQKSSARSSIHEYLKSYQGKHDLWVRVNGQESGLTELDIEQMVSESTRGLVIPKIENGRAIAIYLLVQIAMIENSRMPVDDPKTHLELTMVHEVMILDYSGVDLALIQTGTNLKFVLYGGLLANLILPVNGGWQNANVLLFFLVQAVFASAIGLMESFRARKKLAKNPQFIVTLSSIALIGFILVLLLTRNLIR